MTKREIKATTEQDKACRDAAYERGWVDSLSAFDRTSCQPTADIYDYRLGWDACANYRWKDPANRGKASDPNYREPRT